MSTLSKLWTHVRVYVLAFAANLAAQSIFTQGPPQHITWAAVSAALLTAVEVTVRQYLLPSNNPNGIVANLSAAYSLVKDANEAAQAAKTAPVPAPAPAPAASAIEYHPAVVAAQAAADAGQPPPPRISLPGDPA